MTEQAFDNEIKATAFDAMAKALDYEQFVDRDPMTLCTAAWELWRLRNDFAETLGVSENTDLAEIARLIRFAFYAAPAEFVSATVTLAPVSTSGINAKAHVYDAIVDHLELEGKTPVEVANAVSQLAALKREANVAMGTNYHECGAIACALRRQYSDQEQARSQVQQAVLTGKPNKIQQALWNWEQFEGQPWWDAALASLQQFAAQERTQRAS